MALACTALPAFAASDGRQTVKVGVYGDSIYAYQDENGVWRGIDIECLTNIAQREGLDLEFIDSADDPDFLSSLDAGTYDILTDVVETPNVRRGFCSATRRWEAPAAPIWPCAAMTADGSTATSSRFHG